MTEACLTFESNTAATPRAVDETAAKGFIASLRRLYAASTCAGTNAAQHWADIAIHSDHPLAPLAHIPGAFAALWTPDVASDTALTLGTAGFGFVGVPKHLVHFSSATGAKSIVASGHIRATRIGLFGPGVYLTSVGRPMNLFVQATSRTPVLVKTPAGTARIIPRLVYVRWGFHPVKLP